MAIESPGNFVYNLADRMELDCLFIKILNQRSRNKKHKLKKYWIIPGVEAMLEKLEKRLLMGIVSARDEASSLAFIHQFGLRHYFKVVVTSQTCHHTKPFPDPLLFAARELNIEPEKLPDGGRHDRGYARGPIGRYAGSGRAVRIRHPARAAARRRQSDPGIAGGISRSD